MYANVIDKNFLALQKKEHYMLIYCWEMID
jgi:hypothetical protein